MPDIIGVTGGDRTLVSPGAPTRPNVIRPVVVKVGLPGRPGEDGKDGADGPPGPPGESSGSPADPGDLTLIFDNKLIG